MVRPRMHLLVVKRMRCFPLFYSSFIRRNRAFITFMGIYIVLNRFISILLIFIMNGKAAQIAYH